MNDFQGNTYRGFLKSKTAIFTLIFISIFISKAVAIESLLNQVKLTN